MIFWKPICGDLANYLMIKSEGQTVMDQATLNGEYVYSRLAKDPDLAEIVDLFVEEMSGRVAALLGQLNAADWEGLRRTAHQLKGAAGSYGFDGISPIAGKVESAVRDGEAEERIRATVEELIDLCGRTRSGQPPS
jgi:histidine phosphotransfer protein HptB